MRALVLGGYGATGSHAVDLLRRRGDTARTVGRDPARADLVADLRAHDRAGLLGALDGVDDVDADGIGAVDVVVNMAGIEDPALVGAVTDRGVAFVDITATTGYVAALERLRPAAPVLVDVGLAPGLTNLLAAEVHAAASVPGPVDVAIFAGAAEHHGKEGVAWIYDRFGRRFTDPSTGEAVRNYTQPERFDIPDVPGIPGHGRRRLYRADFSDQHGLTRDLGVPVRTYLGLDSRLATTTLALLTHVPGAARAPKGLRFPGGDGWVVLARGHDGTRRWATGRLQSYATAVVATTVARRAVESGWPPGVHRIHQVMALADIPTDLGLDLTGATGATRGPSDDVRSGRGRPGRRRRRPPAGRRPRGGWRAR